MYKSSFMNRTRWQSSITALILGIFFFGVMVVIMPNGVAYANATNNEIVYSIGGDINSLDPTQTTNATTVIIYRQLYDTLLMVKEDGTLEPRLAESWEMADDQLSYTFHLRNDAYCHNGEKLTAEDVANSLNMIIKSVAVGPMMVNMKDAEAIDDLTVKLNMTEPYSAALIVVGKKGFIYSKKTVNFDENPIGTGPYRFVSRSSGDNIKFTAADNYYRGEPSIKNLTFKVIVDTNTQIAALQKGEVDFLSGTALTGKDMVTSQSNLVWKEYPQATTQYVTMCELVPPFNNVLARKAVQASIDKDAMLIGGNEGRGKVLKTLFPATLKSSPEENYVQPYSYDLDQAKAYIEQYKQETGVEKVPVNVLISESASYHNAGITLEGMLREAGFDVTTEIVAGKAFWASLMSSNYQIAVGGWTFPIRDCDSVFPFLHSSTAGANNFSPVIDENVDKYFEMGRAETDEVKRTEDYHNLQIVVDEMAYYIPLYSPNAADAYNADLKGVSTDDSSDYFVFDWSW